MYRLPRAVLTQILAVRRKKEQGLPVDDGTEGWMLELVELMEMQVRTSRLLSGLALSGLTRTWRCYSHCLTVLGPDALASV